MKEVSAVLRQVAESNCYDGFIHYVQLGEWSKESGIPLSDCDRLLESWPYNPVLSMALNSRGNCVDFAATTVRQLTAHNVTASIAGQLPDTYFNSRQRTFLSYQHVVVIGESQDDRFMCEPGWNLPEPVPYDVPGRVYLRNCYFQTLSVTDRALQQRRVGEGGQPQERIIDLEPLDLAAASTVTKQAMRLPTRRMSLSSRLEDDPENHCIRFDGKEELTASLPYLPRRFLPHQISARANRKLSKVYGFDVKEELLACFAVKRALPGRFWVR